MRRSSPVRQSIAAARSFSSSLRAMKRPCMSLRRSAGRRRQDPWRAPPMPSSMSIPAWGACGSPLHVAVAEQFDARSAPRTSSIRRS